MKMGLFQEDLINVLLINKNLSFIRFDQGHDAKCFWKNSAFCYKKIKSIT